MKQIIALSFVLLLAGCSGSTQTNPTSDSKLSGHWDIICTPDNHANWHENTTFAGLTYPMLYESGRPVPCDEAARLYHKQPLFPN